MKNVKLKLALIRFGKVVAAGAIAVAVAQIPDVASAVGGGEVFVPFLTALLLGVEKYLQK